MAVPLFVALKKKKNRFADLVLIWGQKKKAHGWDVTSKGGPGKRAKCSHLKAPATAKVAVGEKTPAEHRRLVS